MDRPTDEDIEKEIPYPPGYCHFPRYGEEYFEQITAEQLITKLVEGYRRLEWQKMRERNEALDCRVYARAAASRACIDRSQKKHWAELERPFGPTAKPREVAPPAPKPPDKPAQQQQQKPAVRVRRNRIRFRVEM